MEELDFELDKNPKHKATLHSIMAGSIRPNARPAKSHGHKPKCRCGAEKEDVKHVFNSCPDHAHIRENTKSLFKKSPCRMGKRKSRC